MEGKPHINLSVHRHAQDESTEKKTKYADQEKARIYELATKLLGRLGPGRSDSWDVEYAAMTEKPSLFPITVTFVRPDGNAEKFLYDRPTRGRDMTKKVLHRVNMNPDGTVRGVSSRDLTSREDLASDDPLRQIPEKYFK